MISYNANHSASSRPANSVRPQQNQQTSREGISRLLTNKAVHPKKLCAPSKKSNFFSSLSTPTFEKAIDLDSLEEVNKVIKRAVKKNPQLINEKFGLIKHSPLTYTVSQHKQNALAIISTLLSNGADINTTDGLNGDSALILSSQYAHQDVMELLLSHQDTDINLTNNSGKSALYYAFKNDNSEIIQTMLNNGASLHDVIQQFETDSLENDLPGTLTSLKEDLDALKENCLKDDNFNIGRALEEFKSEGIKNESLYLTETSIETPDITQTTAYKNHREQTFLNTTVDKIDQAVNKGPLPSATIAQILSYIDLQEGTLASNTPNSLGL